MNRAVAAARVLCITVMGIFFSSRPRDYSNLSRAFRNDFGRPISDDFILSRRVYNLTAAVPNRFQGLTHTHTQEPRKSRIRIRVAHVESIVSSLCVRYFLFVFRTT